MLTARNPKKDATALRIPPPSHTYLTKLVLGMFSCSAFW